MSIAGELSILGTTKSVQRQHLERLYPYIDWSKMPFSSYDDFFALKNILDDCGAVWTNAYGRSNSEDASTRDILPDYSGNGRDIRLYNFGFAGMSGYGGYPQEDYTFRPNNTIITTTTTTTADGICVSAHKTDGTTIDARGLLLYKAVPEWDITKPVKVKAGDYGVVLFATASGGKDSAVLLELGAGETGEFTFGQENIDAGRTFIMIGPAVQVPSGMTFDFWFLADYPGAIVSDGIDDYGQCVKGFSLPNDYTIVAIRRVIEGNRAALASKGAAAGAFMFEILNNSNKSGVIWSYGQTNTLADAPDLFSYQTKGSYNGREISYGTAEDTSDDVFSVFRDSSANHMRAVLYGLGIFTRTLTDEELRVVKNCMMAEWAAMTGELDNITYVADWDGKDRSNDEEEPMRSQWVDKKTGKVINLHNYAYVGMSGWNGYATDFIEKPWVVLDSKAYQADLVTIEPLRLKFKGILTDGHTSCGIVISNTNIPEKAITYRLRVKGIKGNQLVHLRNESVSPIAETLLREDGVIEMDISKGSTSGSLYIYMYSSGAANPDVDITVELLPLYPGALCSDGVDDYGQTAEAISEEVGTMLVYGDYLTTKAQYLLSCGLATEDTWLYATLEDNNGVARVGKPDRTVTDTMPMASLTRDPASPNNRMILFNAGDRYYACAWLSRLILIREQLDDAAVEFLKWKVDKEYRDWLIRMGLYEEEIPWYGIEFDTTDPSPDVKRIGNMEMHRTLPMQSQMRGCLLNDDGTVAKYLDAADWTSETRDGSAGQVMVEMPKNAYWRFETWGTKRRVKFATTALPGFTRTPQGYVSAYEASVQRSASKLCSVVNTDADYRGGNNSSDRDGTYRSQLGLPATAISRTNFRTYARNRNADSSEWNCMTYDFQKLVYWLFAVEYATLNTQKTFNADRDADGLSQGGLGAGVTTVNYYRWHNFNGVYPFIPCGHTDSLGNGTGQIQFTMPFEYDASPSSSTGLGNNYVGEYLSETAYTSGQFVSQGEDLYECISDTEAGTPLTDTIHFSKVTRTAVQVPRYRGLENPFGHIWQWTDGINVRISPDSDNGGDGLSKVFVTDNPEYFNDSNYDNMSYIGNETRSEGYIKEIIFGEGGEIMPSVVGGSSTTYFCDYHYTNILATENLRGVLFGGPSHGGAYAGFGSAHSTNAPSDTTAYVGSRLCFIPEKA